MKAAKNKYINPGACGACKGLCCKTYAGIYAPHDFKEPITVDFVLELIKSNKYTLDFDEYYTETGGKIYYIRPRHIDEEPLYPTSMQGTCINWSFEVGCGLSYENRPYQCQKFIPQKQNLQYNCFFAKKDEADKTSMVKKWVPYQEVIITAKRIYLSVKNERNYPADAPSR